jgi:hypothetical protein
MGYRFPSNHEQRVTFAADEVPTSPSSRRLPSRPPSSSVASSPGEARKSRPSFAEIDVVEADLTHDARFERV